MKWNRSEIDRLSPILEQLSFDLSPIDGKRILVLCSAAGDVAMRLAEMMETGKVTGLEMDKESLELARRSGHEMGLEGMLEFLPAEIDHISMPDASFEALVSDCIVYPTSTPTQIGQPEMARVLAPGGRMILTDVITTVPLPTQVRQQLTNIGLDYVCDATQADFRGWMKAAGLIDVQLGDLTATVRAVWEERYSNDPVATHEQAYSYLLEHQKYGLGSGLFYIYGRGDKPKTIP